MESSEAAAIRTDVFKNVHKGLRKALFELALQAGATDPGRAGEAERLAAKAREVFHFLEHHAYNEDTHLAPMLEAKGMAQAAGLRAEHAALEAAVAGLRKDLDGLTAAARDAENAEPPADAAVGVHARERSRRFHAFYLALNRFIADYLRHIDGEEVRLLPTVHARFTEAELGEFSRKSVANTAPPDQAMMLGYMFPAMHAGEVAAFLGALRGKVPPEAMEFLEGIARRSR